MMADGARAVNMNLEAGPTVSSILRRYACHFILMWSASSRTINRLKDCALSDSVSLPAGGGSSLESCSLLFENAARDVLPARVSDDFFPSGRRKVSNDAVAPLFLFISLMFMTWTVDVQVGPKTWRA